MSLVTPDYAVGIAIADIRYLASGFCYLFDIKRNALTEQQWLKPCQLELSDSTIELVEQSASREQYNSVLH